jgi:hypothetical protein
MRHIERLDAYREIRAQRQQKRGRMHCLHHHTEECRVKMSGCTEIEDNCRGSDILPIPGINQVRCRVCGKRKQLTIDGNVQRHKFGR